MKISKDKAFSIMESLLFMSPEPRTLSDFESLFEEELSAREINKLLEELKESYNEESRGICLEKVRNGWQLRTKTENQPALLRIKPKSVFRLSRPSLEVLSVIAFEQPCTKMEIDEIRGVDSGHLLRTLMEKELIRTAGKSDLPGKASLYKTSSKFLEVFGLNSLDELPSQNEIEELFTEQNQREGESLESISEELDQNAVQAPYQKDEEENKKIRDTLKSLPSTVKFLETKESDKSADSENTALETKEAEEAPDFEDTTLKTEEAEEESYSENPSPEIETERQ